MCNDTFTIQNEEKPSRYYSTLHILLFPYSAIEKMIWIKVAVYICMILYCVYQTWENN